jgi:transaldolase/glucose-6-phosphate isomerase
MAPNPLIKVQEYGQSIWLDYIRRRMITSGELKRLIEEDGLRGVTSNPKIFDKVISGSTDYDGMIAALSRQDMSVAEIYRAVTVEDVQMTADVFRGLYESPGGDHGFVSLEVNPHLAYRTQETIEEARELWQALDRPNVFIKVPATLEGLPAIQQLISEGINVNVTLLFGLPRYRKVAGAFIAGLEQREAAGKPLDSVRSVASFFLSRIDVLVDPQLEDIAEQSGSEAQNARNLQGQIAIASAKQAYQIYKEMFRSERFRKLADKGGHPQRVLWASTSTKNPEYSDIKYVDALIGPQTVNTIPQETLNAYRDHGQPEARLEDNLDDSRKSLELLGQVGIDIDRVTDQLEAEGVDKFNKPFDSLMKTLAEKRAQALQRKPDLQHLAWGTYGRSIERRLDALEQQNFCRRLWRREPGLWSEDENERRTISKALGWLYAPEKIEKTAGDLMLFRREAIDAGFKRVVHMGMGGSSLAPMVFQRTFSPSDDGLPLEVLDSTDPSAIAAVAKHVAPEKTLFIAASKSGTTAETIDFMDYFYAEVRNAKGERAGENFVAITDPGTPLVTIARERGFRRLFVNYADVGGRYSALTLFGMVPAALMGLDVETMLARSLIMLRANESCIAAPENPGLMLGAALGELALQARNKITFVMPEQVATLGMWLEQLLAESTGKGGTGLLPIAGESLDDPEAYGDDRVFVNYRIGDSDGDLQHRIAALRDGGHPVITIQMGDRLDLAQEFYRWEIAVAVAGAILGINPFNQPNVKESKDNTRAILEKLREAGTLPEAEPDIKDGALAIYGSPGSTDLEGALRALFETAAAGDYCALLAYIEEDELNAGKIAADVRRPLQRRLKLATTLGYGPRYLHSTGQLHKGGPNTGLYLMLTGGVTDDLPVPGRPYSFGKLRLAQAIGDFQALQKHGRRALRIHLGMNVPESLDRIGRALHSAIG